MVFKMSWIVAVLLTLSLGEGFAQSDNPVCSESHANGLAVQLDKDQKVIINSLLETFTGLFPNPNLINTSLETMYEALSHKFSRNTTRIGYCHFLESLNIISAYYHEASIHHRQVKSEDVHELVNQFSLAYSTKNSVELCNVFAKILNIKDYQKKIQRREADYEFCPEDGCSCPEGGINSTELFCSCQFFSCLDNGRNLMPVFEGFEGLECLAFVLDTTGSMKDEIDVTVQVIKDFIASEELGCYILVPFNDDGNATQSVGPVTLTYVDDSDPNSIKSLKSLVNRLEKSFRPKSGGDCPEFCYDGITEALNTEDYGYPVMVQGSQLMVITDGPSKGIHSALDVIGQASNAGVCIHFFLGENSYNCFEDFPGTIEEYETIASTTGGVVVKSKFDFSTFVQRYRNEPCGFLTPLKNRRKRNVEGVCHNFNIASLVCLFSLSIKTTEEAVTLTRPDNERIIINATKYKSSSEQIALFSESHPLPGEWRVCGESSIEVSVDYKMCIDITPFFITHTKDNEPFLTADTSPGCTSAHISLISTRSAEINSPRLFMLDQQGNIASNISVEKCGNSMSNYITTPNTGTYHYQLRGEDTAGNSFSHTIQRKILVQSGANLYSLSAVGSERFEISMGQIAKLRYKLQSNNPFGAATLNLNIAENITPRSVQPSQVTLSYGETVDVLVSVRPANSSQQVTLIVSNDCLDLTSKRTVIVTAPRATTVPDCYPHCLNGGSCVTIRRRRRQFHVCRCAPNYRGRACEINRN